jgi:uncharacterized protein (DUF169 family)
MESRLAKELKLRYHPVAVIFSDKKPENALQFKEGKWGCVISMLTAAAKGKIVALDRKTVRCMGGRTGVGFGNAYAENPGWIEYFLSTGKPGEYEGEAYKKTPELAKKMIERVPATSITFEYVILKPLNKVDPEKEKLELVIFYANPDQLSALTVLANYGRPTNDNVAINMGSACSTVCLYPYQESQREMPKAVIGLTDVTARPYVDPDILAFTIPYKMFLEMEADVPGSFLEKKSWLKLRERIK